MRNKKLLNVSAALIIFIFLINLLAMKFFWYYTFPWFDMPMHFLGGLWVALATFYLFNPKSPWLLAFLSVLVIGILWEVFEFSLDAFITLRVWDSVDTLGDLFFDLLGASVGAVYYAKISLWPRN